MEFTYCVKDRATHFDIPYGTGLLSAEIPTQNVTKVLVPNEVAVGNGLDIIQSALDNPIGSPRLEQLVQSGQRIVIICDDITRPTPTKKILPHIMRRLNSAGVSDNDISIIMALGSHRPMTKSEMVEKIGEDILSRVAVHNSEFRDERQLVDLGEAPGKVRVLVDRRVIAGDIRIGLGGFLPHPAVGWSGGG